METKMKTVWAVDIRKKSPPEWSYLKYLTASGIYHTDKAFLVEAATAKKAKNAVQAHLKKENLEDTWELSVHAVPTEHLPKSKGRMLPPPDSLDIAKN